MSGPDGPSAPIYLDHNASSPLDPAVLEAMRPHWLAPGNPESRHGFARGPRRALEAAREAVAEVLGALPDEVVFTSGGTESNNLAIDGLARAEDGLGHLVCSPIEHPAVAEAVDRLDREGFEVDRPGVSAEGMADPDAMAAALRPDSRLATLILAHNETGVIQDVGRLASLAGEREVPVHTDAVQAVGRIPVDFRSLGVATMSASAHKFHGPVGSGLLLVRRGVRLSPMLVGGGQQGGARPGTPAVALAVGFAEALRRWHRDAEQRTARWRSLREHLEGALVAGLGPEGAVRVGPADPFLRLPQTLHIGIPGLDGDLLLMQLDLAGVAASLGSACASGSTRPSDTLRAMGIPADRLRSTVRFSFGASTTADEVVEAARRIVAVVQRIRAAGSGTNVE